MEKNGIIKTAKEAGETWNQAIKNEQAEIENLINKLDNIINAERKEIRDDGLRYTLTIQYKNEANGEIAPSKVIEGKRNGERIQASTLVTLIDEYVYISASQEEIVMNGKDETVILYYAVDKIGTGSNLNIGDGVPDKYQIVVSFYAQNGTVTFSDLVLTKFLKGVPSEDGVAILQEQHIPEFRPLPGYKESGTWEEERPIAGATLTKDTLYEFRFEIDDSSAPVAPDTPPPATPVD